MAGLFKRSLQLLTGRDDINISSFKLRAKPTSRELIQREGEIGGRLFGAIPEGHSRQFFNLDPTTWVWHEEWVDGKGKSQVSIMRYEIRENGIMKVHEGMPYHYIEGAELRNLVTAIRLYYKQVTKEIYHRDPLTGKLLAA